MSYVVLTRRRCVFFFNNQELFVLMITSLILMSSVLDSAVMMLGENRYQSLLEVKGLTIFPFSLRLSKQFEITSLFSQILKNHFFFFLHISKTFFLHLLSIFLNFFRLIHVCLSNDEVESQWMAVLEAETVFKNFMYILENSLNGESNYELPEGG